MAGVLNWLMGDLCEARRQQIVKRTNMFTELGRWKNVCPRELADYHEWHALRGLQQQREWLDNPSIDLSWKHIREIDTFISNFDAIQPTLSQSPPCAPCSIIRSLL